jgi:hypothetical protein
MKSKLIALIVFTFICGIMLNGCGQSNAANLSDELMSDELTTNSSDELAQNTTASADTPEDVAKGFFDAIKAKKYEKIPDFFYATSATKEREMVKNYKGLFESVGGLKSYKIISSKEEKSKAANLEILGISAEEGIQVAATVVASTTFGNGATEKVTLYLNKFTKIEQNQWKIMDLK